MNHGGESIPAPGVMFEADFMSRSLEQQIQHCDHYELAAYFRKWLPTHQPILEAGCGSGRWVAWFTRNGWEAAGLDWSAACCERAAQYIPHARFEVGDMRDMPFTDGEFGAIVSLGAIEHSPEGPKRSLGEYHRVLRADGVAIITVPYWGPARKLQRILSMPRLALSRNSHVRCLFGKSIGNGRTIHEAKQEAIPGYAADYIVTASGWEFYQYHFSKPQMRAFLKDARLEIIEEFVDFGDEGILHNFGRIAGTFDYDRGTVSFTFIGKLLRTVLPTDSTGHMLCYLVRKRA